MKRKLLVFTALLLLTAWMGIGAEELVSVAHISYLEGALKVTNRDGNEHNGTVNFPVVTGDVLRTNGESRGEIQLGNGTILRIDQDSEILIGTILAPTLTSRDWKVTTLELKAGSVYVISNTYNMEMLQLVSKDVAVKFSHNSNIEIRLEPESGTRVISHWGNADLLIENENIKEQVLIVKSKNAVLVGDKGQINPSEYKKEGDFLAWNKKVDDNFKQLHEGVSYVPDKIVRHKHLQLWAERWSSHFGTWIYDKMFGYVWKPSGFAMDPYRRPFYNGQLVVINDVEYVIPNEPWGWAPAHLGTWVFFKKWGWTWVPGQGSGDIFMPQINTVMDWLWRIWGSPEYFSLYLDEGVGAWNHDYAADFGCDGNLNLDAVPLPVRTIIKKMELTHPHVVKKHLAQQSDEFINKEQFKPHVVSRKADISTVAHSLGESTKANVVKKGSYGNELKAQELKKGGLVGQAIKLRHDWNPDRQWASENRVQLLYSSQSNSVIVPQKQFDSASLTRQQRNSISRTFKSEGSTATGFSNSDSSSSSSSTSSSTGSSSSGSSSKEIK